MVETKKKLQQNQSGDIWEEKVESRLRELLEAKDIPYLLYPSVRVPRTGERGKYEIDLLLLTVDGLLAIEVKGWVGSVRQVKDGFWRQNSSTKVIDHEDAIALNNRKLEAIESFLLHHQVELKGVKSFACVVWVNKVDLDPKISAQKESIKIDDLDLLLDKYVQKKHGFFAKLKCLFRGRSFYKDAAKVLALLPTWDEVVLKNGDYLKGDFTGISEGRYDFLDRNLYQSIEFLERSKLMTKIFGYKIKAIKYNNRSKAFRIRHFDGELLFQMAGDAKKTPIPFLGIQSIVFGGADIGYSRPKTVDADIKVGKKIKGRVTGVQDFGVFVRVGSYQDGLVHLSELEGLEVEDFSVDQELEVKVLKVIDKPDKKHIHLKIV